MRRSGFGAAISHAVARSSIVFSNSISRYRIVMAASKLLVAAAACVILYMSFAAETRESCWSGCIKAAIVICEQIFSFFCAEGDFPFRNRFKSASKSSFFWRWRREPVLELQFLTPLRVVLLCFAFQYLDIAL